MPDDVVHERFDRLLKVVNEAAKEQNGKLTGNTELVLVEEIDEKDDTMVTGRLSNNSVVHFKGRCFFNWKDCSCCIRGIQRILLSGEVERQWLN